MKIEEGRKEFLNLHSSVLTVTSSIERQKIENITKTENDTRYFIFPIFYTLSFFTKRNVGFNSKIVSKSFQIKHIAYSNRPAILTNRTRTTCSLMSHKGKHDGCKP